MSKPDSQPADSLPSSRLALPVLLFLFAGSGCAALVYEIVWFQLLQLVIGSSAVSLGILLGTFMGGMCLGSLALPRLLSVRRHPLRVYAAIELALGGIGVAVLYGMPYVGHVYTAFAADGLPGMLLRGAVAAVCLLPPTVLMGATLPAVARWVEATPQSVSRLGFFYGGNIAGAVFGCLLAGFYLLRVHDLAIATYAAAAVNGAVALVSFGLAAVTKYREPVAEGTDPLPMRQDRGAWAVYAVIAVSGACALGAEVIWTRLLSLMLGATVYTFSIILAVFLVGLGVGSALGSLLAREPGRARAALGCCQWLLAPAIAWAAFALTRSLPYWPVNSQLAKNPRFIFELDLVRCLWAVLPATCLWGASFPLALAAVAAAGRDPGRLVGGVYAANTVGAIAGALGASLFLVHRLGTQNAQRVLIALSAAAAVLAFLPSLRRFRIGPAVSLAAAAGLAGLVAWTVTAPPWELIAFGRTLPTYAGGWSKLYSGEGMTSSVAVTEVGGARNFHVSGKVEASSEPQDMRLQRMLGHLPALVHPRPRSVLVVGCGAGVTAGSFVTHPGIERIVVCEIEPLIPRHVVPFFAAENYSIFRDRRVQLVHDDARHFVLRTPETFDVITSDPIHPWVKGSATLYTKEYFELCKRHLNPGGVISQWVPLYESNAAVVQSQIATFFDVFPHGTVWGNDEYGEGYDLVLLAQVEPTRVDADEFQERLERDDHAAVAQSLKDVGFGSGLNLLASYAGQASDLRPWLEHAQINRDRNLRLQYLAGLGLNAEGGKRTYQEMLAHRAFPEDLFVGSGLRSRALRGMLVRQPREP